MTAIAITDSLRLQKIIFYLILEQILALAISSTLDREVKIKTSSFKQIAGRCFHSDR